MNITENINYLQKFGIKLTEAEIKNNSKLNVVVGMSGGVDSSVCALLCKLQGYNTTGIYMKNWEELDQDGNCTSEQDYKDVVSVCERLEIPYYSLNFVEEYRKNVFDHFLSEYKAGNTPNPDILCNSEIKFKVFYEKVLEFGADYLATGHYCQVKRNQGRLHLCKGFDQNKDQSYFLHGIDGNVLSKVLFPIGHLPKPQVRQIALDYNLDTKLKKDSTGICFIGERNFKNFLSQYLTSQKGSFIHLDNSRNLGEHDGYCYYTIGQRKGLGLGGPGGPWFVADKDRETNTVFVVEGEKHPALYVDELCAEDETWILGEAPKFPLQCQAKVRYRQADQNCIVTKDQGKLKVVFDRPQRAIAKSQSIVFYSGDICLGGATIAAKGKTYFERAKDKELILPVF